MTLKCYNASFAILGLLLGTAAAQIMPANGPIHQTAAHLPASTDAAQLSKPLNDARRSMDMDSLRRNFRYPPGESGPWAYWITWDNAITAQELLRELEVLVTAGFSGAEMRFVESPWLHDRFRTELTLTGHRPLEFLSPEFLECVRKLCERAKQRGFKLALNLGMGWPPGGTWITPEHQSKCLLFAESRIEGGKKMRLTIPKEAAPAEMVFAWKVSRADVKEVQRDSFTDLTKHLASDRCSLDWDSPLGSWLIGFFKTGPGGKLDKASGFAADPGSASAMRFHLDYVFSRLDAALSKFYGSTITDISSDSWEYDNRPYWTDSIFNEFKRLNGYDLRSAMHVWFNFGPELHKVQEDLRRAENALVCTNFYGSIAEYTSQRRLLHRPQVRGRGLHRDFFDVYARSDIPEVEQEIFPAEAVWVAHMFGKPIVSMESYTFISQYNDLLGKFGSEFGAWEANPDLLRRHANLHFAHGINRIQMHCFSYSPPGLPLPGWRMYAETHLNEYVTWWPYMHLLNRWISRNQLLLQSGIPVADTVVYPLKPNPPEVGIGSLTNSQPACADNGVDGLPRGWLGRLNTALRSGYYACANLLLLEGLDTPAEAKLLADLLDSGLTVACLKSMPDSWACLPDGSASALGRKFQRAFESGQILDLRGSSWHEALSKLQSVSWIPTNVKLRYQHRRFKGGEAYFLVNDGPTAFDGEVSFPTTSSFPEIWNADTGEALSAPQYRREPRNTCVKLTIKQYDSAVVAFSGNRETLHATEATGGTVRFDAQGHLVMAADRSGAVRVSLSNGSQLERAVTVPPPFTLDVPWTIHADKEQCYGIDNSVDLKIKALVDWHELPELRSCFGIVQYVTEFRLEPSLCGDSTGLILELGKVCELAKILVNGRLAGVTWSAPYRLDITDMVRPGTNTLRIEVPNHFAMDAKLRKQMVSEPARGGEQKQRPSGLIGPAKVQPYAVINLERR